MKHFRELIASLVNKNRRSKALHYVTVVLSAFIVFVVTYALVLPAVTLELETADADSGIYLEEEALFEEEVQEEPAPEEVPAQEEAGPEQSSPEEVQPEQAAWEEAPEFVIDPEDAGQEEWQPDQDTPDQDWADASYEDDAAWEETQADPETETEQAALKEFTWEENGLKVKVTLDDETTRWPADTNLIIKKVTEEDEKTRDLYKACLEEAKKQEGKEELELSYVNVWKFVLVSGEDEFVIDAAAKVEAIFEQPIPADEDRSGRVLLYQLPGQDKKTKEAETKFDSMRDTYPAALPRYKLF